MAILFSMARMLLPGMVSVDRLTSIGKLGESISTEETTVPSVRQRPPVVLFNSYLPNVRTLEFHHEYHIKDLREEFRDVTSLTFLDVSICTDLEAIPEWIDSLTSLQYLQISRCPKLTSLPHAISNLPNLKSLGLHKCSRQLEDRCSKPTGEDWPKIQHIPGIFITPAHDIGSQFLVTLDEMFDAVDMARSMPTSYRGK